MLDKIKKDGIFILNTSMSSDEVLAEMSNHDKDILQKKNIKMYVIDASKIAMDAGLPGKISTIMETVIFKLGKIIDFNFAIDKIKENLTTKFANKGGDVVKKNITAMDQAIENLNTVKVPYVDFDKEFAPKKTMLEIIDTMDGDSLPVSTFIKMPNGEFEAGTSKFDKVSKSIKLDIIPGALKCLFSGNINDK
jgi:pyruvate-ferredoxin/flavodoxin oxidoreductase